MREIGSEFWDAPTIEKQNGLFSESKQWFLSGRSALKAIIKDLKDCHTVAMPSWCCDSMIKPFVDAGLNVQFYPVYWQDELIQEMNTDCDVLFLIDYFGYTSVQSNLKGYKGIVIRDVTHSVFSSSFSDADYYFGSLRKWCGVWTGGYAWTKDGHGLPIDNSTDYVYRDLREKAMNLKNSYIKDLDLAEKTYLKLFDEAEECLESIGIAPAAERDVKLAAYLDIKSIKNSRRTNANVLRSAFSNWLLFSEMRDNDCPLFVPILVPEGKRTELRNYLINQNIYCPIHWPVSNYHKLYGQEKYIYDNELSLVCDQRYKEEDMFRIVKTINNFWKVA